MAAKEVEKQKHVLFSGFLPTCIFLFVLRASAPPRQVLFPYLQWTEGLGRSQKEMSHTDRQNGPGPEKRIEKGQPPAALNHALIWLVPLAAVAISFPPG